MSNNNMLYTIKSMFVDERGLQKPSMELRRMFVIWLHRNISKRDEFEVISTSVRLVFIILFPIENLMIRFNKEFGYDPSSDSVVIYGVRYSRTLFQLNMVAPEGVTFRFVHDYGRVMGDTKVLSLRRIQGCKCE